MGAGGPVHYTVTMATVQRSPEAVRHDHLLQEVLGEVGAVLAVDSGNERVFFLHGVALSFAWLFGRVASNDAPINRASAPNATFTVVSKNLFLPPTARVAR